mmetsp:Transcript_9105/g.21231  ORF Transcript_9105/g.21231 Transcript_9105/m.21231 type:complete len:270 (-) Transcript_9105:236-1045(-)
MSTDPNPSFCTFPLLKIPRRSCSIDAAVSPDMERGGVEEARYPSTYPVIAVSATFMAITWNESALWYSTALERGPHLARQVAPGEDTEHPPPHSVAQLLSSAVGVVSPYTAFSVPNEVYCPPSQCVHAVPLHPSPARPCPETHVTEFLYTANPFFVVSEVDFDSCRMPCDPVSAIAWFTFATRNIVYAFVFEVKGFVLKPGVPDEEVVCISRYCPVVPPVSPLVKRTTPLPLRISFLYTGWEAPVFWTRASNAMVSPASFMAEVHSELA